MNCVSVNTHDLLIVYLVASIPILILFLIALPTLIERSRDKDK